MPTPCQALWQMLCILYMRANPRAPCGSGSTTGSHMKQLRLKRLAHFLFIYSARYIALRTESEHAYPALGELAG